MREAEHRLAVRLCKLAPRLPPFQPGFLKAPLGGNAFGRKVSGKLVRRVEHRDQSLIEQALLAEVRVRADRLEFAIEPFDDLGRCPCRRDQSELHLRFVMMAEFGQRRHVGE